MKRIIRYKDKKNSSGRIKDGVLVLDISSRLSLKEQQEHIEILTRRLLGKLAGLDSGTLTGLGQGEIYNHGQLQELARRINDEFYGFPLRGIRFYQQNSIWGSCNYRKGTIHISHRLQGAPEELLHYVVVHELCHLKVPNHSRAFWDLVARGCPEYKKYRKLLQVYGMGRDLRRANENI
ncbi:MAG: M48 family metallopeptidase [Clostridia bacterium]|nr:M48 family metallopeptidase [Clostridia bacterium]